MQLPDWLKNTLGGGTLTVGFIGWIRERAAAKERENQRRFDQIKDIANAAMVEATGLRAEVAALRQETKDLRGYNEELLQKIEALTRTNEAQQREIEYLRGELGVVRAIRTDVKDMNLMDAAKGQGHDST